MKTLILIAKIAVLLLVFTGIVALVIQAGQERDQNDFVQKAISHYRHKMDARE